MALTAPFSAEFHQYTKKENAVLLTAVHLLSVFVSPSVLLYPPPSTSTFLAHPSKKIIPIPNFEKGGFEEFFFPVKFDLHHSEEMYTKCPLFFDFVHKMKMYTKCPLFRY
jgi:hypothetical protein